jgi:RNA polymerase sigma factor (TIGR02999 family)
VPDETPQHDVTCVPAADHPGPANAQQLLTLVYDQLRKIARQRMSEERVGHTLQATALVHEAYVRLIANADVDWDSRGHFFTAAAEAMRRILIEHARARAREKRGGPDQRRLTMDIGEVADLAQAEKTEQIIALDDALRRLKSQRPRVAQVVHLRFYAGLSVDETARTLGVSARTVDLDWAFARAWLYRQLVDAADAPGETDEQRRPRSHTGDLR